MTNPLDDVKTRADALKVTVRSVTGMPKTSFRDVLSTGISNVADQMVAQMRGQNQTSQPTGQAGMKSQQPSAQQQGSRPRVLGTIFRSMFGQRSQQGIQQQQPAQNAGVQDAQTGQPDVAQIQKDLQDKQTQEHEARLRRQQRMSVSSGDEIG